MLIPKSLSITHQHLLAAVATEMRNRTTLRIIDAGCGNGILIKYLQDGLAALLPQCQTTVTGFDISDFAPHGHSNLTEGTQTIKTGEPWPYSDHSVDVILSNQVLEHVFTPDLFFREIARCLKQDGVSIHLFPLKHVIYEDHVCIPLAHRICKPGFIRTMAKIGFFKERALAIPGGKDCEFGECAASYLKSYTRYLTCKQVRRIAASIGLKISFDYTSRFYTAKLRSLRKLDPVYFYPPTRVSDNLAFWAAKYVSSITLVLRPA